MVIWSIQWNRTGHHKAEAKAVKSDTLETSGLQGFGLSTCHYLHALHLNPIAAVRAHGLQKLSYQSAKLLGQVLSPVLIAFSSITGVYSHVYCCKTTHLEINSKPDLSFLMLNSHFHSLCTILFYSVATKRCPDICLKYVLRQ